MEAVRKFLKQGLTGKSAAEIKMEFPDKWEEIIKFADNKENGFYREPYASQHFGPYYRYKSR